jgi:hypothetical protein
MDDFCLLGCAKRKSSSWLMVVAATLACLGCGETARDDSTSSPSSTQSPAAGKRGGTITVGGQTWTIVPSTQCSVYSESMLNIAGHAEEDGSLEIVIDFGGPNQVRVGEGRDALWHAVRDSINMEVDGRRVRGTANFTKSAEGAGPAVPGSWEVDC